MSKQQILTEAMALDPRERDELAEALWQGIVPGELTAEQALELRRRLDALNKGQVQLIPGQQVMLELRERYQG